MENVEIHISPVGILWVVLAVSARFLYPEAVAEAIASRCTVLKENNFPCVLCTDVADLVLSRWSAIWHAILYCTPTPPFPRIYPEP